MSDDTRDDDPDQLGAAATLDFERKRRRSRRRSAMSAAPPRPPDESGIVDVYEAHAAYTPHLPTYVRSLWARREFLSELAKSQLRSTR